MSQSSVCVGEVGGCDSEAVRDWGVEPRLERLKDENMARERMMQLGEEETGYVGLLQMLHPEKIALIEMEVVVSRCLVER